jgi:aldose 1-epimerase
MEAREGLPSGKLLPVAGTPFDFRSPQPLAGKFLDDVFFGLKPEAPATVEFQETRRRLVFAASADFAHLVVWTPKDAPFFCIENQTCSTDAHNLHAQGLRREANLQVAPPGKTASGQVELRIEGF